MYVYIYIYIYGAVARRGTNGETYSKAKRRKPIIIRRRPVKITEPMIIQRKPIITKETYDNTKETYSNANRQASKTQLRGARKGTNGVSTNGVCNTNKTKESMIIRSNKQVNQTRKTKQVRYSK